MDLQEGKSFATAVLGGGVEIRLVIKRRASLLETQLFERYCLRVVRYRQPLGPSAVVAVEVDRYYDKPHRLSPTSRWVLTACRIVSSLHLQRFKLSN